MPSGTTKIQRTTRWFKNFRQIRGFPFSQCVICDICHICQIVVHTLISVPCLFSSWRKSRSLLELTHDEVMIFLPKAMEEIGSRLNRVRKAVQSGDMEAATRHAHTVKSVAGSVGAVAVRETAARSGGPLQSVWMSPGASV